ncbi:hypothetical protein Gogos_001120, partial [Gossypium gossypioides]|nr:hypothetical protein [Gossypium gossypioides]
MGYLEDGTRPIKCSMNGKHLE